MGEPAPWSSWDSFSEVNDNSFSSYSSNDTPVINVNAQAMPTLASLYVNTLSAENALLKLPQASGGDTLAVSQRGGDNIRTGDTIVISQTNKDLIEESVNNSR